MWINLPTEVLQRVLEALQCPTDLSNFQQTCKSWTRPAQFQLYKEVSFRNRDRDAVTRFIDSLKESTTRPGGLVKTLRLGDLFDEWNYRRYDDYLTHLAEICPNVEFLDADNPVSSFWEDLAYVLLNHWPSLKHLPQPLKSTSMVEYALSILHARKSLACITILPHFNETLEGLKFITNLKYFTNLKSISLIETTTPFNIDELIQDCLKLEILNADIEYDERDFDNFDSSDTVSASYDGTFKSDRPHIKSLGLCANFSFDSLLYILKKFGKLESLTLRLLSHSNEDSGDLDWKEMKAKFINYLFEIASFTVYCGSSPELLNTMIALSYSLPYLEFAVMNDRNKPILPSYTIKSNGRGQIHTFISYMSQPPRQDIVNTLKGINKQVYKINFNASEGPRNEGEDNLDYIIEDILEHCTSVSYLHYSADTIKAPLRKENLCNESVRGMTICASKVETLHHLSCWLPYLNRLKLHTIMDTNTTFLNLSFSSLNYFSLELTRQKFNQQDNIFDSTLFLKIDTDTFGKKTFLVTKSTKGKGTAQEYSESELDSAILSVHIRCKDLKVLCIRTDLIYTTLYLHE